MPTHFELTSCDFRRADLNQSRIGACRLSLGIAVLGSHFRLRIVGLKSGIVIRKFRLAWSVCGRLKRKMNNRPLQTPWLSKEPLFWAALPLKSGILNEVWEYKQPLRDNLKSCYAKFSLSEIRYLPPSRAVRSVVTLAQKYTWWNIWYDDFIQRTAFRCLSQFPENYTIKVNDFTSDFTLLRQQHHNLGCLLHCLRPTFLLFSTTVKQ